MASKPTGQATNGSALRQLPSWIDQFVEYTSNTESAEIFRRWAGISVVAAALERKVWVKTYGTFFPNLYIYLVGEAGIGKTVPISKAREFISELKELPLGATSMTMASLVDKLVGAKRTIVEMNRPALEFNSMYIIADELSAFMHKWETDIVAGLTTFYDSVHYSQVRRTMGVDVKIERPILNILCGSTPSNLIRTTPDSAWEQGYMSRVILIFSRDRRVVDLFGTQFRDKPPELVHDLKIIASLYGEFGYSKEFGEILHEWRLAGCPPEPTHPKLKGYVSRRVGHLIKLTMVSCVDRGSSMLLEAVDFQRALGWLREAEDWMPEIFQSGAPGLDAQAMDEIHHFIKTAGKAGVHEQKVMHFARLHVQYSHNMVAVLQVMERSGMIKVNSVDKDGLRVFAAI